MDQEQPTSEWTIDCLKTRLESLLKANGIGVWHRGEVCFLIRDKMGKKQFSKWVEEQGFRASAYRWIGVYEKLRLEDLEGMSATECYDAVHKAKASARVPEVDKGITKPMVSRQTKKKVEKGETKAGPLADSEPTFEPGEMRPTDWVEEQSENSIEEDGRKADLDKPDWEADVGYAMIELETALEAVPDEAFGRVEVYRERALKLAQRIQCVFRLSVEAKSD